MPTHSNAPLTVSPSKGTHLPPHMLPEEGLRIRLRFFANESPYLRRLLPGTNMASFENQIESTATCIPRPMARARARHTSHLNVARCGCRACPGEGRGLALPCFSLSISPHFPPRPSAPVRPAPWQIRLVSLCRLFRHPPAGPSASRPARAWQLRLVSLCPLVRRASNPSCTASLQAQAGRKKRDGQFKANQTPEANGGLRSQ